MNHPFINRTDWKPSGLIFIVVVLLFLGCSTNEPLPGQESTLVVQVVPADLLAPWTLFLQDGSSRVGTGTRSLHDIPPGAHRLASSFVDGWLQPTPFSISLEVAPASLDTVTLDYRKERKLTNANDVAACSFSPDELRIAYHNNYAINIFDIDSGHTSSLASFQDPIQAMDWAPDGQSILIARNDELYTVNISNGNSSHWYLPAGGLCDEIKEIRSLSWSRNMRYVTIGALDSYNQTVLFSYEPTAGQCGLIRSWHDGCWSPRFAKTSDRVAYSEFQYFGGAAQRSLYTVGQSGDNILPVTSAPDGKGDFGPDWSPDDSRLCFYSNRNGDYCIWTVSVDGASPRRITDGPNDRNPRWSPYNSDVGFSAIALIRTIGETRDIWLVAVPQ